MLGVRLGHKPSVGSGASPLYLLSSCYYLDASEDEDEMNALYLPRFKDFVWMSYRCGFRPMKPPTGFTTDAGWGCMLRSAQMLLAEVLIRHLGRKEWGQRNPASDAHRNLLRWFLDAPKYDAYYSIHRMTETGRQYGKQPGEWYGPNTVALVLRDLVHSHNERVGQTSQPRFLEKDYHSLASQDGKGLTILVTDDSGTLYLNEVRHLCEEEGGDFEQQHTTSNTDDDPLLRPNHGKPWKSALLIIVPLRLGLVDISGEYSGPLVAALKFKQCVGMIGGRPAHSLYFVGSQGSNLVYLDPHTVQQAGTNEECDDEFFPYQNVVDTYHCASPLVIPLTSVDPSLAIGFYCESQEQLADLVAEIGQLYKLGTPFMTVGQDRPTYDDLDDSGSDDDFSTDQVRDGKTILQSDDDENEDSMFFDARDGASGVDQKSSTTFKQTKTDQSSSKDDFVFL